MSANRMNINKNFVMLDIKSGIFDKIYSVDFITYGSLEDICDSYMKYILIAANRKSFGHFYNSLCVSNDKLISMEIFFSTPSPSVSVENSINLWKDFSKNPFRRTLVFFEFNSKIGQYLLSSLPNLEDDECSEIELFTKQRVRDLSIDKLLSY